MAEQPQFYEATVRVCLHCGGSIDIRNPEGYCDHLKYPESCRQCQKILVVLATARQTGREQAATVADKAGCDQECCGLNYGQAREGNKHLDYCPGAVAAAIRAGEAQG